MSVDRPAVSSDSLAQWLERDEEKCCLVYNDDFGYFEESFRTIGRWALNDFLAFIKWPKGAEATRVPAIQFYVGQKHAYTFALRVSDILRSSYIYRKLRTGEIAGYQRALNPNRISKIREYVESNSTLAFPNSIILMCDHPLLEVPKRMTDCPAAVEIFFPSGLCSNRIVDGQHRALGFAKAESAVQESHSLPVIAFDDLGSQEEVQMFMDINSKQKRVDRNLILLLREGFVWNKGTREFDEAMAVKVCRKLSMGG